MEAGLLGHSRPNRYKQVVDVRQYLWVINLCWDIQSAIFHRYLEHGGQDALVKPWVWIACIAMGSICFAVFMQLYGFLSVSVSMFNQP